jgi:hypothetical protein
VSDVEKWKVRGAVKALRTEFATWDLNQQEWQPPRHFGLIAFHSDGKISERDHHNADGSISHSKWFYDEAGQLTETRYWMNDGPPDKILYFYDDAARHVRTVQANHDGTQRDSEACSYDISRRKTKVHFLGPQKPNVSYAYEIEGTGQAHGAPGAATMTVSYDERDLPAEVLLHDAHHSLLRRVIFVRDSAGRLLSEEIHLSERIPFPDFQSQLESYPPEDRARASEAFASLFGPTQMFSKTTCEYDQTDRLLEQSSRMGSLAEDRTTFRYDEHDNPIEETTEHTSREASLKEDGTLHYSEDRLNVQHARFEYRYDAHGNWTERIVSIQPEPDADFQRSNIERRAITYHAD